MSKIAEVHGSEDYKLLIDFEDGSKIEYNMAKMVKTLPYRQLKELSNFQKVKIKDKLIFWDLTETASTYFPLCLSIDHILLSLRE